MAIGTEEGAKVHAETAQVKQTKEFEMSAFQTWVTGLPWFAKEAVILGIILSPVVVLVILLKVMGF